MILPVGGLVEELSNVSHASGDRQTLSQGASAHIDEVQAGGGVTLEVAVNLAQLLQVGDREKTSLGPSCRQKPRGQR